MAPVAEFCAGVIVRYSDAFRYVLANSRNKLDIAYLEECRHVCQRADGSKILLANGGRRAPEIRSFHVPKKLASSSPCGMVEGLWRLFCSLPGLAHLLCIRKCKFVRVSGPSC